MSFFEDAPEPAPRHTSSRTAKTVFWSIIGAIAAIIGVIVGFIPVSDCGSVFAPASGHGATVAGYFEDAVCSDSLAPRGWVTGILIGVGLVVLVIALMVGLLGGHHKAAEPRNVYRQPSGHQAPSTAPGAATTGSTDRLVELARLHESGALTDDEFTRAKARLLSDS